MNTRKEIRRKGVTKKLKYKKKKIKFNSRIGLLEFHDLERKDSTKEATILKN